MKYDTYEENELVDFYQQVENTYMNFKPLLSAIVSGVGAALLAYLANVADIWSINIHGIITVAVIALVTSIGKYYSTTQQGNLVGVLPIAEPK